MHRPPSGSPGTFLFSFEIHPNNVLDRRFQASLSLLMELGRCPVRHAAPPSHPLSFVLISAFSAATNAASASVTKKKTPKKSWPKTPTHPLFTVCLSVSCPCRTERDTERKKPSMFFSQWKVSFSEQKILCHVLQWTTCWVSSAVGQRLCLHPLITGNASVCCCERLCLCTYQWG